MLGLSRLSSQTGAIACLLAAATAANCLQVQDGKLQAISSTGIAEHTVTFPSDDAQAKVLALTGTSTLKLAFTVQQDSSDESSYASLIFSTVDPRALPNQLGVAPSADLPAEHPLSRTASSQIGSVSVPLNAKKGGKYRWEWDLSLPSNSAFKTEILKVARRSDGRLKGQLLVAPLNVKDTGSTVLLDLGTVAITDEAYYMTSTTRKYPREWEVERYAAREPISWTFREARKPVGSAKALLGLALVLSPWLLLLGLTSSILPSLSLSLSSTALPFLASLAALESAIASYWFGAITVWSFMPAVGTIGLLAIFSGKAALGEKMRERLSVESDRAVGVERKNL